jgi:hypothetical protein
MVPFTIFHRLSSLGSGGGVKAGKIPPFAEQNAGNRSAAQGSMSIFVLRVRAWSYP